MRKRGFTLITPLFHARLADLEADLGRKDAALATLDLAISEIERTDHRTFAAEVHRIRGEILLRIDGADIAAAKDALHTAIAVAKQQGACSFELRAAFSLAKLYQSTNRLVEAHDVLAPALEGFAPTPEMPEIAEAEALLAAVIDRQP